MFSSQQPFTEEEWARLEVLARRGLRRLHEQGRSRSRHAGGTPPRRCARARVDGRRRTLPTTWSTSSAASRKPSAIACERAGRPTRRRRRPGAAAGGPRAAGSSGRSRASTRSAGHTPPASSRCSTVLPGSTRSATRRGRSHAGHSGAVDAPDDPATAREAAASRPSARRRLAARAASESGSRAEGGRAERPTHAPSRPDVSATHAASATSAGVSSGNPTDSSASRAVPATIAVSAKPGQTALIEMPRSESGGATLRTNPTTACFVSA